MRGRELFKCAVQRLPEVVRDCCAKVGVTLDDVDWFLAPGPIAARCMVDW